MIGKSGSVLHIVEIIAGYFFATNFAKKYHELCHVLYKFYVLKHFFRAHIFYIKAQREPFEQDKKNFGTKTQRCRPKCPLFFYEVNIN